MVKRTLAAALIALLSACDGELEPRTQLMLVADTDVPAPGKIDFEIVGPDGRTEPKDSPFASAADLPRTLALVHTEGPLGPFKVSASIELRENGTTRTITRAHTVSFARGKTLLVPLHLARACLDECGDRACSEHAECIDTALDSTTLMPYDGLPGRVFGLDAGAPQADGGFPAPDAATPDAATPDASATDAGADGGDDPGVATDPRTCGGEQGAVLSDVHHCGDCGVRCPTAPSGRKSSGAKCVAGVCALICDEGWGDCNDKPNNGCEVNLMSNNDCGACGVSCVAGSKCMAGRCL